MCKYASRCVRTATPHISVHEIVVHLPRPAHQLDGCVQGCKPWALLNKGAHHGAIVSLDAQATGSLLLTGGADYSLRCYDAAAGFCIAVHGLTESLSAVALHPASPLALVAQRSAIKCYDISWCGWQPAVQAHQ